MKALFVTILSYCLLVFVADANELIRGEIGEWNTHWIGFSSDEPSRFTRPDMIVAQAIEAARDGNAPLFYSFWGVDSNTAPTQIKSLYEEWHICSERYVYLIGHEAFITNNMQSHSDQTGWDVYSAVSIFPAMQRNKGLDKLTTNGLSIKAKVIFSKECNSVWMLLSDIIDKRIEQTLLEKASPFLYVSASDYSTNGIAAQMRKYHGESLEVMQKNGVPPEGIVSKNAKYKLEEMGVDIKHWTDWTNYFQAVILDPPITFEKGDACEYNYRDVVSAFQSYVHAGFTGNAGMLLKYADESGLRFLKRMGVNAASKSKSYDITNSMTHVIVLLTATANYEGKDYALVFWRSQNIKDPRNGFIALQKTIFVNQNGEYLLTKDLDESYLGDILNVAHANGGVWEYLDFEKVLKNSEFPKGFYNVP